VNPPPGPFAHRIRHVVDGVTISQQKFDRCPKAWLRDSAPAAQSLCADFRWLKVFGVLPAAGGKLEQDPRFIDAVEVLEGEVLREEALIRKGGKQDGTNSE